MSQIEDNLFLGSIQSAQDLDFIKENNIKRVISVCNIELKVHHEGVDYKLVYCPDDPYYDLLSDLPECIQNISDSIEKCQSVYVHCFAGVSRSSTVVIAYLMKKYQMNYKNALNLVKSKRDYVNPNEGFVQQLLLFEEMKYTLNANYHRFRVYLVDKALNGLMRWFKPIPIKYYFEKLSLAESLTNDIFFGPNYVCILCDKVLFNQINVIENENSNENRIRDTDVDCGSIYIEPQEWMTEMFKEITAEELYKDFQRKKTYKRVINCPNCSQSIGILDFNNLCHCPLHIRLNCLSIKTNNVIKLSENN